MTTELGWIVREQPTDDSWHRRSVRVGREGCCEGSADRSADQFRSDASYFRNTPPDCWWFRLDKDDLEYGLIMIFRFLSCSTTLNQTRRTGKP